ncbi:MAG: hypothetical protein L0Y74_09155 [candidate division Zixibacteria bacterium]|nr:hypothetical protein [candidate division Zixibacteria bacterium]MCI0532099.1 hypothetical protein [candidate division Zixibacteria bacterium]
MTKKVILTALFVVLAFALLWAGDKKAAPNPQMEQWKAEAMKCAVCKNMVGSMEQLMPVMKMEVVKLDNGMAMTGSITDPKQVGTYHGVCDQWSGAFAAATQMADDKAKTDLCQHCQSMRGVVKAGAQASYGKTKTGDLLVFSSNDPAVQAQIGTLYDQCVAMMSQMEMPKETKSTEKKKY